VNPLLQVISILPESVARHPANTIRSDDEFGSRSGKTRSQSGLRGWDAGSRVRANISGGINHARSSRATPGVQFENNSR
jgi:hypothetical protein